MELRELQFFVVSVDAGSLSPVSYTHLDVYKRQEQGTYLRNR